MSIFFLEAIDGIILKQKDIALISVNRDIINSADTDRGSCQRICKICAKCRIFNTFYIKAFKRSTRITVFIQHIYSADFIPCSNRFRIVGNSVEQRRTICRV